MSKLRVPELFYLIRVSPIILFAVIMDVVKLPFSIFLSILFLFLAGIDWLQGDEVWFRNWWGASLEVTFLFWNIIVEFLGLKNL